MMNLIEKKKTLASIKQHFVAISEYRFIVEVRLHNYVKSLPSVLNVKHQEWMRI
jgi:hypothetical protein